MWQCYSIPNPSLSYSTPPTYEVGTLVAEAAELAHSVLGERVRIGGFQSTNTPVDILPSVLIGILHGTYLGSQVLRGPALPAVVRAVLGTLELARV